MTNHPTQYKLRHADKENKHAKKTKGQEKSPVLFYLAGQPRARQGRPSKLTN
ncbi:hypothetical protein [Collimonas sp. OK607]|uniref:hypothetical protein n=1 Tax=Collimonas sp. OK607 TaxID=1798194 RepID=UPI0014807DBE|nr:hypothetical protein [Collimonas sp. OK607]